MSAPSRGEATSTGIARWAAAWRVTTPVWRATSPKAQQTRPRPGPGEGSDIRRAPSWREAAATSRAKRSRGAERRSAPRALRVVRVRRRLAGGAHAPGFRLLRLLHRRPVPVRLGRRLVELERRGRRLGVLLVVADRPLELAAPLRLHRRKLVVPVRHGGPPCALPLGFPPLMWFSPRPAGREALRTRRASGSSPGPTPAFGWGLPRPCRLRGPWQARARAPARPSLAGASLSSPPSR